MRAPQSQRSSTRLPIVAKSRFRPRYRALAVSALGIGGALAGLSIAVLGAPLVLLASGAAGVVLGAGYLLSPTWKLEVIVDADGYEVRSPKATKFRVPWSEVKRVIASPSTNSCFIDTGAAEHNLLVPGVGAPAPYDLDDKAALVAAILEHVSPDKVRTVESLADARS